MKGKNPTRKQKVIIKKNKLNPSNWLVLKSTLKVMHIKHKQSNKIRKLEI